MRKKTRPILPALSPVEGAQFHIGIRQYYTGSTKLNHPFFKKLQYFVNAVSDHTTLDRPVICARFCRYALNALQ